ncbi:MAG: pullulanase-type alpha-1,6-glucosidase [Chloroflexi bacterium]|nr:pullulanase-type alpha-1,6-glucosidase [Chloroflexota bacterium]MCC6893805.1 pullulanase-type alpha-1,6-glucosidase [Anaerolineae bacterium]
MLKRIQKKSCWLLLLCGLFVVNIGQLLAQDGALVVTVPGSYNSEIGCPKNLGAEGDWAPDCDLTRMTDSDGDGIYIYVATSIPVGSYEAKIAINKSWSENYGADGAKDGANIPFEVPVDYAQVTFTFDSVSKIMTIEIDPSVIGAEATPPPRPETSLDLTMQQAQWVTKDTILWNVSDIASDSTFKLYFAVNAGMIGDGVGFQGGASIDLTYDPNGVTDAILERFPHLADYAALKIGEADLDKVASIIRQQAAVVAIDAEGKAVDGTGLQLPGVLDDLFHYEGALGITYEGDVPTLQVWAPTAQQVALRLFDDSDPATKSKKIPMTLDWTTGVWSVTGEADWTNKYYLYEVKVYAPTTQQVETNLVTDPYSISLAVNSTRSQIVNLNDASLMPEGWGETAKPALEAPEDAVIYELHVRDFSIHDETVPENERGTFKAFTEVDSNGMKHLIALAEAGLTHIHLLPVFDIATIEENRESRTEPDWAALTEMGADSEEQQALIDPIRDQDGFNWGYDPYHFNTPEGSYSTDPNGTARILEFREMVQSLNENGLRVVMDVVYNHTNASGENDKSVLDKIVPGYYHRLNARGGVETSTCCQNTATEHWMMEKLMIDSVVLWATAYKVDGFRFDLMGHHMKSNMEDVRAALDALTVENDGVDGKSVYVYGEGWNFGEVENNARGVNATQFNMAGTGIGTFNDRMRDAVRGGSPFGGFQDQGFAEGLFVDPNGITSGSEDEQLARLNLFADQIRVGLAGNLKDYSFVNAAGETVTGADVVYNGQPAGYNLDPQEHIVYVSAHDNETLFDAIQMKSPETATMADRVRMQNLANSLVLLSQGVPFFHAGDDILRSKSGDRNSYNSGDWFNRLDFTYESNNWGVGLPPAGDNRDNWGILQPLLANPELQPSKDDILGANAVLREFLQIRKSSPLFRLQTADDVQARLTFQNVGTDAIPGLIVMTLSDTGDLTEIDPNYSTIVVLFNSSPEAVTFTDNELQGMAFELHPVQASSSDTVLQDAAFNGDDGSFSVPGRTTAVFVLKDGA